MTETFHTGRNCANPSCGKLLTVKPGESGRSFNARRHCDRTCSRATSTTRVGRKRLPIVHGTVRGYKKCHARPEGACDECRQAQTDDGRTRRVSGEYQRRRNARERALRELAMRYPDEYQALLEKEQSA